MDYTKLTLYGLTEEQLMALEAKLDSISAKLDALAQPKSAPRRREDDGLYIGLNTACRRFGMSRSTFYRMLDDPQCGLAEIVVRIPPGTGRIKIPVEAFEKFLTTRRGRRRGSRIG